MINHLSISEFTKHLEIYAETELEKKSLQVINEIIDERDYYREQYTESDHIIDQVETERDDAENRAEEAEEKLNKILEICEQ